MDNLYQVKKMDTAPTGGKEIIAYVDGYGLLVVWESDGEWWWEEGECYPLYWIAEYAEETI